MLKFIKSFFGKTTEPTTPAPYKVEAPEPAPVAQPQCGCGRSASGFCVGLHKLTAEEWAVHADNPAKKAPAKKAPAKKKPAVATAESKPKVRKTKKPAQ